MHYRLKYKITNTKNNLFKIIKGEKYGVKDLTKIIFFYENIGFKVELIEYKIERM